MSVVKIKCIKAGEQKNGVIAVEPETLLQFEIKLIDNLILDSKGITDLKGTIESLVTNYAIKGGEVFITEVEQSK